MINFPKIETIDDVLPHIKERDEIVVADRGDHTVINYVVVYPDTFLWPEDPGISEEESLRRQIIRECRGLIFDNTTGSIIRRPYHKFKNANEDPSSLFHEIDWSIPHAFLEKLDGSMIAPFIVGGDLRWGTRMGVTDVADQVIPFVEDHPHYIDYARRVIENGWTPIFEWCSRSQKIVIDHPEDRLVLTGARQMNTGVYITGDEREMAPVRESVPSVRALPITSISSADDIHQMPMADVGEGTVIRFDNGHMVKIKTAEYVRIHRVKERVQEERHIVMDLLNHDFDDTIAMIPVEDQDELRRYATKFWKARAEFVHSLQEKINTVPGMFASRKEFAISGRQNYTPFEVKAIFHFWDYDQFEGEGAVHYYDVDKFLVAKYVDTNLILPQCGTRTKFGAMKDQVFPNISFTRV